VPSTFTEDLPYFDILDYSIEFIRMIPIIKEAIRDRKYVLAEEAEYNKAKQNIQNIINKVNNGEYAELEDYKGLELLLTELNGDLSKWWNTTWTRDNLPEKYNNRYSSSYNNSIYNVIRDRLQANISNNYKAWELLLKRDLSLLNKLRGSLKGRDAYKFNLYWEKVKKRDRVAIKLNVLSIIIDVAGIVLAIISHNFIIAILGLVLGGILMTVITSKFYFFGSLPFSLHFIIISFIAGFGFHSFSVGLIVFIISVVLVVIIAIRDNKEGNKTSGYT